MGGLTDGLEAISSLLGAGSRQRALSLQNQALAQQHAIAQQRMQAEQAAEERRRRERLRQAEGAARARFGAAGIDPAAGSAAAVLRGLQNRGDRDLAEIERRHALRAQARDADHAYRQRRNLLESASLWRKTLFRL